MKVSHNKKTVDIDQIASEFISPMDNYESCEVESYKEAEQRFEQLTQDLQIESDWRTKCQAIDHLIELYKGGIQYFPEGDLKSISHLIAQCILNMRPLIVRKSSILVAVAAQLLKEDFEAAALNIIPALLKQCGSKNPIISNYCHCSILHVIQFCTTKNVAQLLLRNTLSKSKIIHQVVTECYHIILETWPPKLVSLLGNDIQLALVNLEANPNESIRTITAHGESISENSKISPEESHHTTAASISSGNPSNQMITLRSKKDSQQMKSQESSEHSMNEPKEKLPLHKNRDCICKENVQQNETRDSVKDQNQSDQIERQSLCSRSSRREDLTFENVLNPSNIKGASLFKLVLETNLQLEHFDDISLLDQRDFVSSVLFSIQQIPDFSVWKNDLAILLDHFPNYFAPYAINIMSIFSFDSDVYELLANTYTAQSIAEMFVSGRRQRMSDAFNFFVVAFKTNTHQIELSEKMKSAIRIIINSNPTNENTQILKAAIEKYESGPTINDLTHRILVELATNENYEETLDTLIEYNESTEAVNTIIESKFSAEIPKLLSEGTQIQKKNTIQFILNCIGKLKKVSFQTAVEPLIELSLHSSNDLKLSAIESLGRMMQDIRVLASILNFLTSHPPYQPILIEAMQLYFKDAPPNRLITVQTVIVEKLKPFLSGDNSAIRKSVIQIFALFKEKIPKEFSKLMKNEFTPSQKRLIDITAQKSVVK